MKYYVDFSGYCEIEAKNENDAEKKFWELISEDRPLPCKIFEIQEIEVEEKED